MTLDAYLTILAVILVTLIAACIAAAILEVVGARRIGRTLRLPWDDER